VKTEGEERGIEKEKVGEEREEERERGRRRELQSLEAQI